MNELPTETAITYCRKLANQHNKCVGFIPDTAYARAIAHGNLRILYSDKSPCGFVFHGPPAPVVRIYQLVVEPDCRLQNHGREGWFAGLALALESSAEEIRWICAENLPANGFWERVACPPEPLKVQGPNHRRWLYQYRFRLPRGREIETYLDTQLRNSAAWKIAKLQGVEDWLENHFKKRYRRENP